MNIHKNTILSRTTELQMGKINYIVTSHYKKTGRETAEQKLLRYVTSRIAGELKTCEKADISAL